MQHGRPDYEDIQDPTGRIPDDEPVHLLRGQDAATPGSIRDHARRAQKLGSDPRFVDALLARADEIETWQREHSDQVKAPDLPEAEGSDEETEKRAAEGDAAVPGSDAPGAGGPAPGDAPVGGAPPPPGGSDTES